MPDNRALKKDGPEKVVYKGRILEIVEQPMRLGDKKMTFEMARRAPGVRLIIADTSRQKILLTKEYRYEFEDYDYRLPGGKVVDTLEEFNSLGDELLAGAALKKSQTGVCGGGWYKGKVH